MNSEPHEIIFLVSDFDRSLLPPEEQSLDGDELRQAIQRHLEKDFLGSAGASEIVITETHITLRWKESSEAVPLVDRAVDFLTKGDYAKGIQLLKTALSANPRDEIALYNLGMALSDQGDLDTALAHLNHLVTLDPEHSNAWVAIGVAEARRGNIEAGAEALRKSLAVDPENGYALRNLGALEIELGELDLSLERLLAASRILPQDQQVWLNLGRLHEQRQDTDKADAAYLKVLELDSTNQFAKIAEEGRSRIAESSFRSAGGDSRPDAMMYCLGALQTFAGKDPEEVQAITYEIAMLGMQGLDVNDPEQKYRLKSLPGNYSGLHLLCIEYVGFKQLDPSVDIGFDLSEEYQQAQQLHGEAEG